MLGVSSYPQDYVDAVRGQIDGAVTAYAKFAKGSSNGAVEAFEPAFFNNLVLALDRHFVHRVRKNEGKDGNPLNEVRVLCDSLVEHGGVMTANSTIKMKPEDSVLGIDYGDKIAVREVGFRKLADGFLGEIEARFP